MYNVLLVLHLYHSLSLSFSVHSPTRAAFVSATITVVFANSLSEKKFNCSHQRPTLSFNFN